MRNVLAHSVVISALECYDRRQAACWWCPYCTDRGPVCQQPYAETISVRVPLMPHPHVHQFPVLRQDDGFVPVGALVRLPWCPCSSVLESTAIPVPYGAPVLTARVVLSRL